MSRKENRPVKTTARAAVHCSYILKVQFNHNWHFTVTPVLTEALVTTWSLWRFTDGDNSALRTLAAKEPILKTEEKNNTSWHMWHPWRHQRRRGGPIWQHNVQTQKNPARGHMHLSLHSDIEIALNWQMYLQGGCNHIYLSSVNVNHKIAISYQIVKGKKNGTGKLLVITLRSIIGRDGGPLFMFSRPRVCLLITNHELPPRLNFCLSFYLI